MLHEYPFPTSIVTICPILIKLLAYSFLKKSCSNNWSNFLYSDVLFPLRESNIQKSKRNFWKLSTKEALQGMWTEELSDSSVFHSPLCTPCVVTERPISTETHSLCTVFLLVSITWILKGYEFIYLCYPNCFCFCFFHVYYHFWEQLHDSFSC